MGESENDYQGPPGSYDSYLHTVILSSFQISITEITNEQYTDFLNQAYSDQLIEVFIETNLGPNMNDLLVFGTDVAPPEYIGKALYNLSGARVMKDHDNDDGDNDPFTGEIESENPLNIAFIGFDEFNEVNEWFYVKDPSNPEHFKWVELTDYYNYTDIPHQEDVTILLNDYNDWEELVDYPNNLPSLSDVKNWPVGFITWYGAKAFVSYYNINLPTEAQWEYAAKAGNNFLYATSDGNVNGDGTSANWNNLIENPSRGHVLDVFLNDPNPYGIYNLSGNVWEWMEDWYTSDFYLNTDGATDPVNTTDTGFKVRRGGSWNYHEATLKSSTRAEDEQFKGNDHFGFRVVQNFLAENNGQLNENYKSDYLLFTIFPNPFNPVTNIKYSVPENTDVSIRVYDINGNMIKELYNGNQVVGTYNLSWDADNQPSGLYFVKMTSNNFTQTQKLMLVK